MNEQNEIPAENTLMPPQPEIPAPAGQLVYTQAAIPRTYTPHTATKWDTLPHDAVFACLSCLLGFVKLLIFHSYGKCSYLAGCNRLHERYNSATVYSR